MSEEIRIGAEGVDVARVMNEIRADVKSKKEAGLYEHLDFVNLDKYHLDAISDDNELLFHYFRLLYLTSEIDINDFEIKKKHGLFAGAEVLLKKIIWKLLKFYTFRLFSQQINFNGSIVSTLKCINRKIDSRDQLLEKRIAALEQKLGIKS